MFLIVDVWHFKVKNIALKSMNHFHNLVVIAWNEYKQDNDWSYGKSMAWLLIVENRLISVP